MKLQTSKPLASQALSCPRDQKGNCLIELVIAIGITGIILTASCQAFSQIHRLAVGGQNQVLAAHIAQELLDNARNQRYTDLMSEAGTTRTLEVNKTTASSDSTSSGIMTRPLLLDLQNLRYRNYSAEGSQVRGNAFRGTATQTVTALGGNMLRVAVTVSWPSENGSGTRTLQNSTVVSQFGIHN